MELETLIQGNNLMQKISEFEKALNCFERVPSWDVNEVHPPISLNPSLIIEFDDWDDGRDQIKLPMVLSDYLIELIKNTIKEELADLKKDFSSLK